jgi:hypothetical protein
MIIQGNPLPTKKIVHHQKNKDMKKILVLGFALAIFAASATAQGPGDRIARQRIENGAHHGQLTRGERFHLNKDQSRYKNEKRRAFRDGKITRKERKRLHAMKHHNSRKIYRMKHNGRRRLI